MLAWQTFYQLSCIPSSIASFLITQNLTGDPDYTYKSPAITSHIMRLHVIGTLGTMEGACNDNDFHLATVRGLHEMQTSGDTGRPLFLQDFQIPKCENLKHGIKHKL